MWACQSLSPQEIEPSHCFLSLIYIQSLRFKLPATHPIMILSWWDEVVRALEPYRPWCLNPTANPSLQLYFFLLQVTFYLLLYCLPAPEEGALKPKGAFQQCSGYIHQMFPEGPASQMQHACQKAIEVLTSGTSTFQVHQGLRVTGNKVRIFFQTCSQPQSLNKISELIGVPTSLKLTRAKSCWWVCWKC